jgi:hypothetical protein
LRAQEKREMIWATMRGPKKRALFKFLKIISFVGYSALVVCTGLEVGVRILRPQMLTYKAHALFEVDPRLGWVRAANYHRVLNMGDRDVEVCTDEVGDRVSCERSHRSGCKQHVLVVGDSFVEALSVPFEETVWGRIERDTGACVHVAGAGGYGPAQYRENVRERIGQTEFALLIVSFYAGNDISPKASSVPPPRVWAPPWRLLPEGLSFSAFRVWLHPLNRVLESRSHAWVAIRYAYSRLRARGTTLGQYGMPRVLRPSLMTEEVVAESVAPLRELSIEARKAGARVLLILIPIQAQVLDPDGVGLRRAFPEFGDDLNMDLTTTRVLPLLEKIPDIELVDLLPALRKHADRSLWGARDRHFSPEGHRLWFEIVRPYVRRLLAEDDGRQG